ncbi:hypothetical protein RBI13_04765 [Alcaligenaceae bacterium A4P071]|nr:hypothetical protein [Alcaligenaceae bacterium B3P038]MDQ2147160.1 hypothetical protein [Alcaligenaceae bacterium C4P045]MDQ2184497.1 hypothetical protein [Alcaligenaceae bacterium A4P071]
MSDQHKDQAPTKSREGAHEAKGDEKVASRSADPGQSSYGGFKNEDTKRQAQETDGKSGGK